MTPHTFLELQQDSNLCIQGYVPYILSAKLYNIFSFKAICIRYTIRLTILSLNATCFCRGTRIRTLTDGFGDHNATVIPYLCKNVSPFATPLSGIYIAVVGVTIASLMVIFIRLVKELSLCSFPNCVAKIQPFFISQKLFNKTFSNFLVIFSKVFFLLQKPCQCENFPTIS